MGSLRLIAPVLATLLLVAACGAASVTAPAPTPVDFTGIASELTRRGVTIDRVVSGDAGCEDPVLVPTAIGFDASGLDQADPVRLRIYIFRDRDAFERLEATVGTCARTYVTRPEGYESIATSPYVVAAQGPWPPRFEAALREALGAAAGDGD